MAMESSPRSESATGEAAPQSAAIPLPQVVPPADPVVFAAVEVARQQAVQSLAAAQAPNAARPHEVSGRPDSPLLYNERGQAVENLERKLAIDESFLRIGKIKEGDALNHWALGAEFVLLQGWRASRS